MDLWKDKTRPAAERAEDLVSRMSLKEKLMIIIETSEKNERLGIPKYYHGNEALHGIVRPGRFTVFPQAIGLGSMFDPELLEQIASAASDESRARYHHGKGVDVSEDEYEGRYNGLLTFWSPDLNLARDPRWGRTAETYGEDPYLAGKLGAAFVRGLQGADREHLKAVATPKHFTANNEEHNRFSCNAVMPEKTFREYHLRPFEIAVKEGHPEAVMGAYNAINGIPCHENRRLLHTILREEWGFDGYVVTDCGAIARLWDSHKRYEQPENAASAALNAGVDLECGSYSPYEHFFYTFLEQQLAAGKVTEKRIDEACRRVLTARFRLGQLDAPEESPYAKLPLSVIGCEKHKALAYRAAAEAIVLLKNNGILPLSREKRIAVVGNNAAVCQYGDYSGKPVGETVSPLEGLREAFGENVRFVPWKCARGGESAPIPADCLRTPEGEVGLRGDYYDNAAFFGEAHTRTDGTIDFAWRDAMPDPFIRTQQYSIRWTGYIVPRKNGVHPVALHWNGSAPCEMPKLYLDGKDVGTEGVITAEAGKPVAVTVEYRKSAEDPRISLVWSVPDNDLSDPFLEECEAAAACDAVVAVVGLGTDYEREGRDRESLGLPPEQTELLRRIAAVNKNIILVLLNGGPLTVPEECGLSEAVLEAWYPGQLGGRVLADLITGKIDPSGRLCATFPYSVADIPAFDDYDNTHGRTYMYAEKEPLFPFGFGLSYTSFAYRDARYEDGVFSFTVRNTGTRAGDEVVQVYADSALLPEQPKYRLIRFARVSLAPGEEKRMSFALSADDFSLYDADGNRGVNAGTYTLYGCGSLPTERSRTLGAAEPVSLTVTL